jgi:hypothetical protein
MRENLFNTPKYNSPNIFFDKNNYYFLGEI